MQAFHLSSHFYEAQWQIKATLLLHHHELGFILSEKERSKGNILACPAFGHSGMCCLQQAARNSGFIPGLMGWNVWGQMEGLVQWKIPALALGG